MDPLGPADGSYIQGRGCMRPARGTPARSPDTAATGAVSPPWSRSVEGSLVQLLVLRRGLVAPQIVDQPVRGGRPVRVDKQGGQQARTLSSGALGPAVALAT